MPWLEPNQEEIGFKVLVRRRWRTIALAAALVVVAGQLALARQPDVFEASAKVLIVKNETRMGGIKLAPDAMPEFNRDGNPLFTQVEMLRNLSLFAEVVADLGLTGADGTPLRAEDLAGGVLVKPLDRTDLIQLTYRSQDPAQAQKVLEAVCAAYLSRLERFRAEGTEIALKLVDKQLVSARKRLAEAEGKLLAYKRRIGTIAMSSEIQARLGEQSALSSEIGQQQARLASAQARVASLRAQLGMSRQQAMAAASLQENARVRALQDQLNAAETSPIRSAGLGERHPDRLAHEARIRALRAALAAETRGVRAPLDAVRLGVLRQLVDAETEVQTIASGLAAARSRSGKLNASMAQLPAQEIEIGRLTREVDVAGRLYQQLLEKQEEARVHLTIAPVNALVVQAPTVPDRPVPPLGGAGLPVLLLAGLAVGFGAGVLRDFLSRDGRSTALAASCPSMRIYSAIPALTWGARRKGELVVGRRDQPSYLEALGTLALAVEHHVPPGGKVISLTSSAPREGKSVTLANLALSLAAAGHRVLLVDADVRMPRVHELFDLPRARPGLTDVLVGSIEPEGAVQSLGELSVVTTGGVDVKVGLVRYRHKLKPALDAWRAQFDYVLIDTPPAMVLAEVTLLGRMSDQMLVLANLTKHDAEVAVNNINQLRKLNAPVIGIVVIAAQPAQNYGGYYLTTSEPYDPGTSATA